MNAPLFTNDAVALGILFATLGLVFWTASLEHPGWKRFYTFVPSVLLCYAIPSFFNTIGVVSGAESQLYFVSSRYALPASLVLLTLGADLRAVSRLGSKALIMFAAGTVGIMFGGPLTILFFKLVYPSMLVDPSGGELWRALTTISGSWIGGGANQTAMKEVFQVSDEAFAGVLPVDIIVGNMWMACLLIMAGRAGWFDRWNRADTQAIDDVKERVSRFEEEVRRIPTLAETMVILGIAFGATGFAHALADVIAPAIKASAPGLAKFSLTSSFFWLIGIATALGVAGSLSPLRRLEGAGASRLGSVLLYVLVASIGMKMDLLALVRAPHLFAIGAVWMIFHASLLLIVARIIRAPAFFVAVGSQANVGGAASAPIVAGAFHPSLTSVGALLAVVGYIAGTYGAWLCGLMMQAVS